MNTTNDPKESTKHIKSLSNELAAWEMRIAHAKSEVDSVRKQKDALQVEVESIKERSNAEVEKRVLEARQSTAVVDEARKKLESDKEEFKNILNQFRQERNAFDREKQSVLDMKSDLQKQMELVGIFIRTMKEQAARF